LKVVFKVSKAALEHKVLGRNSSFSFTTFISIAMVGSIIGEFDYTKKFIEKYQHLLDASIRDDIKNYTLAYLAFFSKNYEEVSPLILQVKFSGHIGNKLNAKSLVIRSYYELLERDGREWLSLLRSHLRSFERYLNRTKGIPPFYHTLFTNFSVVAKKLIIRKTNLNRTAAHQEELRQMLSELAPVALEEWLNEKIESLLK
jgi:hypothetical protein